MSSTRVVIVGAGIIGLCAARELARRGVAVTVLDRAEHTAGGCSFGNSGLLSPGHAPLSAPGVLERYRAAAGQADAAGRLGHDTDAGFARWVDRFSEACTPEAYAAGLDALCALTPLINPLYDELADDLAGGYDHRRDGALIVALTPESLGPLLTYAEAIAARGRDARVLDPAGVREIDSSITGELAGGAWFPEWSTLDPLLLTRAVGARAADLGATVRTGAAVTAVTGTSVTLTTGDTLEADAVILATGADAEDLLRPLGVHLPMAAALGWHTDTEAVPEGPAPRQAVIVADRDVILTPMPGRWRYSGLVELTREIPAGVDERRTAQLLAGPRGVIEIEPGRTVSTWVGRRPCLPDGLPAIGPVPSVPGLFVAAGHARMGLTLGPATGRLLAEMICGETLSAPVGAMTPGRFTPAAV